MAKYLKVSLVKLPSYLRKEEPLNEIHPVGEEVSESHQRGKEVNEIQKTGEEVKRKDKHGSSADSGIESESDRTGNETSKPEHGVSSFVNAEINSHIDTNKKEATEQHSFGTTVEEDEVETETEKKLDGKELKNLPENVKPIVSELPCMFKDLQKEMPTKKETSRTLNSVNKSGDIRSSSTKIYEDKNHLVSDIKDKNKSKTFFTQVGDRPTNKTKVSTKGQKSRRGGRRRPNFPHISNQNGHKKIFDKVDCSDMSVPYRLAYIPGRQNVIKVIRHRVNNDSKGYLSTKDKPRNDSTDPTPVFTEQTLNSVEQTNIGSDGGNREVNISTPAKECREKTGLDLTIPGEEKVLEPTVPEPEGLELTEPQEAEEERSQRLSDSSESSLLIDFPLPAEVSENVMKDRELTNIREIIDDSDEERPLVIDESYIPRGAVIRGKPLKRGKYGRQKSRRSLEENENPEFLISERKRKFYNTEDHHKRKKPKKHRFERTRDAVVDDWLDTDLRCKPVQPLTATVRTGEAVKTEREQGDDMDLNHNNTNMKDIEDENEHRRKRKKPRRIRSVSVGSGLKLPIIKPKTRPRRVQSRAASDTTHGPSKAATKITDRMNSFDYISPIVQKVWDDMSKQKIEKKVTNNGFEPKVAHSVSNTSSLFKKLDESMNKDEKSTSPCDLRVNEVVNGDQQQSDDDRYSGTLNPGALGNRPLLSTPPGSVLPLTNTSDYITETSVVSTIVTSEVSSMCDSKLPVKDCHIKPTVTPEQLSKTTDTLEYPPQVQITSDCVVTSSCGSVSPVQISSSPEPGSPPPLVPGKLHNRRHVQKPEPLNCYSSLMSAPKEHSHYTVVAKSDTVLKVSRSPTYYQKLPPLIHDKTRTESPIVIDDSETLTDKPIVTEEELTNVNNPKTNVTEENETSVKDSIINQTKYGPLQNGHIESMSASPSSVCANQLEEDINKNNSIEKNNINKSSSPNVVYLHLNSSDLTNAKTKLLVEELDMLISRRELELQSLYSRRARAIKKLNTQPYKPKQVAKLKTVEISSGSVIEKPKPVKYKGGSGAVVPPPAHTNQEVRRRCHPKFQSSGIARKMSNIRVVKWPRTKQNRESIKQDSSDGVSLTTRDDCKKQISGGPNVDINKNVNEGKNSTGQTVLLAGKPVPVLPPAAADTMRINPVSNKVNATGHTNPVMASKEVPHLTEPLLPHAQTNEIISKTPASKQDIPLDIPVAAAIQVNGNQINRVDPGSQAPSNKTHSEALKEYFVQTHLKEAVKNNSNTYVQTYPSPVEAPQANTQHTVLQNENQELYSLVSQARPEGVSQQNQQEGTVTIEKVLNKLQYGASNAQPVVQNGNATSPLAALTSLAQTNVPVSFQNVVSCHAVPPRGVTNNVMGQMGIPFRPCGPFPNFIPPVNNQQSRLPGPGRFQRPPNVTVSQDGSMQMHFVPPGILQQRPVPVQLPQPRPVPVAVPQQRPVPVAVPQQRPVIVAAPQASRLPPPPAIIPHSSAARVPGQSKSLSNMDPSELMKQINEQVSRMQHQLVQSKQTTQTGAVRSTSACSQCNSQALFLCAACQKVWYCSKECQVKAWPVHQNQCISHL